MNIIIEGKPACVGNCNRTASSSNRAKTEVSNKNYGITWTFPEK
jgi:hypothetical protein